MISRKLINKRMTDEQRRIFAHAFDSYIPSAYIVMLLFSIQSGFRSLYSSIFGRNPLSKFHYVYKELLHEFNLDHYNNLLKLASYIRNTLHNNGEYTHEKNEMIQWRDMKFLFKKGQKLKFEVWNTFIIITEDIFEMLEKLIKSEKILQKQVVIDSSYNNLP
jgi:hypothetical protein